ncbi:hypothetical protein [Sporosarcina sp. JAI121]|uniref:hypothetical protein n=1 Tax=Sporosarcina sp. JAI121 TaxID=2723064 RepID=UPI0015C723EC|nr:hypothetical protein [Sporosarcina sp. JAI121]NYF24575.1 hypothetical protein [Sporosarcina sp. JAI121]
MRILLLAVLLFATFHFIRLDLVEGTIPLASFVNEQQQQCEEEKIKTITVSTVDGDTIETLFALYPDAETGFIDRLSSFYSLNPHLQNQQIVGGEKIVLPLSGTQTEKCIEYNR